MTAPYTGIDTNADYEVPPAVAEASGEHPETDAGEMGPPPAAAEASGEHAETGAGEMGPPAAAEASGEHPETDAGEMGPPPALAEGPGEHPETDAGEMGPPPAAAEASGEHPETDAGEMGPPPAAAEASGEHAETGAGEMGPPAAAEASGEHPETDAGEMGPPPALAEGPGEHPETDAGEMGPPPAAAEASGEHPETDAGEMGPPPAAAEAPGEHPETDAGEVGPPALVAVPASSDPLPNAAVGEPETSILNFDEAFNRDLTNFQELLHDWQVAAAHRAMRDWVRKLHDLVPPMCHDKPTTLPPPVLRFGSGKTPFRYQPGRNDLGLRYEINTNPQRLHRKSEIEAAGMLLHELLHALEDRAGEVPRNLSHYHSAWFRKTAEELGIPCTLNGARLPIPPDGRFARWAEEQGLKHEPVASIALQEVLPARVAKRTVWICACPDDRVVRVQVARASELDARCERCLAPFKRAEPA